MIQRIVLLIAFCCLAPTLQAQRGGFSVSLDPAALAVPKNTSASTAVMIDSADFSGDLALSSQGVLPTGITANLPATITGVGPASTVRYALSFAVGPSALNGSYRIVVVARPARGGRPRRATLSLVVRSNPVVTGFSPASGPAGTLVTINGFNMSGAISVTFNGTEASGFSVLSDNQVTATVPSAATSGRIAITTPQGTGQSTSDFVVIPAPVISSFTPESGRVGTVVTIVGSGFSGTTSVAFNNISAAFTVVDDGRIDATVPTGATSGSITVATSGGMATSSSAFTVLATYSFQQHQAIPGKGTFNWESFSIGGTTYLAAAFHKDGTTYNLDSMIYRWDGSAFVPFQAIPTHHATSMRHFTINGESFLAVASWFDGITFNVHVKIYKWNGTSFAESQTISTVAAFGLEPFVAGGENYLVVTNLAPNETFRRPTKVYKWNGNGFSEFQTLLERDIQNCKSFSVGSDLYMAVASSLDPSGLYKWGSNGFVRAGSITPNGVYQWTSFAMDGRQYLAGAEANTLSLYQWNGSSFDRVQVFPSQDSNGVDAFLVDGTVHIAVANQGNSNGYYVNSRIYRWEGSSFAESQSIPTVGALKVKAFTIGSDVYLAVANHWNGQGIDNPSAYLLDAPIFKAAQVP